MVFGAWPNSFDSWKVGKREGGREGRREGGRKMMYILDEISGTWGGGILKQGEGEMEGERGGASTL